MIHYNNIDSKYIVTEKNKISDWIRLCINEEEKNLSFISINICSDEYILQLNNKSLQHNYYTDIITFELNEIGEPIEADIYISIDSVKENAKIENTLFKTEIKRVIIHGVLHLCGYKDKTKKDKSLMKTKENYYLNKYSSTWNKN